MLDGVPILYWHKTKGEETGMAASPEVITIVFGSGEVWKFTDPSWTGGLKPKRYHDALHGRTATGLKQV